MEVAREQQRRHALLGERLEHVGDPGHGARGTVLAPRGGQLVAELGKRPLLHVRARLGQQSADRGRHVGLGRGGWIDVEPSDQRGPQLIGEAALQPGHGVHRPADRQHVEAAGAMVLGQSLRDGDQVALDVLLAAALVVAVGLAMPANVVRARRCA